MQALSLKGKRVVAFFLFAAFGIVLLMGSPMLTKSDIKLNLKHDHRVVDYVPFEDQPIYESILVKQQEENKSIIDAAAVTAPLPADTVALERKGCSCPAGRSAGRRRPRRAGW